MTIAGTADLKRLVRSGVVRPPLKSLSEDFLARPRPKDRSGSVVEAVLEDRREGR